MSGEILGPQFDGAGKENLSWLRSQLREAVNINHSKQRRQAVAEAYYAARLRDIPMTDINHQYHLSLEVMEPTRNFSDEVQYLHLADRVVQIWPLPIPPPSETR